MIIDNFEKLDKRDDLIDISIINIIIKANNIVLIDVSNKNEIKLLVK